MNIHEDFTSLEEYFDEFIPFLKKYSWLYESSVTNLLTQNIFSKIPEEWIEPLLDLSNEDLNNLPVGIIKDAWPSSLVEFCQNCRRLTLPVLTFNRPPTYDVLNDCPSSVPQEIWRGMRPKKKYEVKMMAAFVHHESKSLGIHKILDIGSGLGYIDRLLICLGYEVLGIESKAKLVEYTRLQKTNNFPPQEAANLNYFNMDINEASIPEVRKIISNCLLKTNSDSKPKLAVTHKERVQRYAWERPNPSLREEATTKSHKVCMIGLHVCGDLAITGIKMYLSLPETCSLVLVPCCYHKMAIMQDSPDQRSSEDVSSEGCERFVNFPLSETLTRMCTGAKFICRPFLRLANQASNSSWQGWTEADHYQHSFNVLCRAVIELFVKQENSIFKKCFRRVVKKTSLNSMSFSEYIDECLDRCEFVCQDQASSFSTNREKIRSDLLKKWEQHNDKLKLVEAVTALQMCLEPVAESLVVADRIRYLQENGIDNVKVVKIMEQKLSPRCLAYVASKT